MNFEKFWKELQSKLEQGIELETLKLKRPFKAGFELERKGYQFVQMIPESGQSRGIPRSQFKDIWNTVKHFSPETRFINKEGRIGQYTRQDGKMGNSFHVSYITALINHIVKDQKME